MQLKYYMTDEKWNELKRLLSKYSDSFKNSNTSMDAILTKIHSRTPGEIFHAKKEELNEFFGHHSTLVMMILKKINITIEIE